MGRALTTAKQECPINPFPRQKPIPKTPFSPVTSQLSSAPAGPGQTDPAPLRAQTDDTKPHFLWEHHEPPARDQIKVQGGLEFSRNIIYIAEKRLAAIHHGLAASWLCEGS